MLLASLLLGAAAVGLVTVVDVSLAAARARTAADAAALAAMSSSPLAGGDDAPAVAARAAAAANGARIAATDDRGWPLRYAVHAAVAPRTRVARSVVAVVQTRATAAVRPSGAPLDPPLVPVGMDE